MGSGKKCKILHTHKKRFQTIRKVIYKNTNVDVSKVGKLSVEDGVSNILIAAFNYNDEARMTLR